MVSDDEKERETIMEARIIAWLLSEGYRVVFKPFDQYGLNDLVAVHAIDISGNTDIVSRGKIDDLSSLVKDVYNKVKEARGGN